MTTEPGKMYACGMDVGSRSTKIVVVDENARILGRGLRLTGGNPLTAAEVATEEALKAARVEKEQLCLCSATGYGRRLVAHHDMQFTAVTCHAAGAAHVFPGTRNVIDIGAVRLGVIRLDEQGRVSRFRLNDRCSAGVGRSLERVAGILEIPLEEIGQLALFSKNPHRIPSTCSVRAETEILHLIIHAQKPADIVRGMCESLAQRLAILVREIWVPHGPTTLTGGMAKNAGMVSALEDALETPINIHHDSEFLGAVGAALIALRTCRERQPETQSA